MKPENFLLKYEDDIKSIKMIDFGLSKKLKEDEILTQPNGTVTNFLYFSFIFFNL